MNEVNEMNEIFKKFIDDKSFFERIKLISKYKDINILRDFSKENIENMMFYFFKFMFKWYGEDFYYQLLDYFLDDCIFNIEQEDQLIKDDKRKENDEIILTIINCMSEQMSLERFLELNIEYIISRLKLIK